MTRTAQTLSLAASFSMLLLTLAQPVKADPGTSVSPPTIELRNLSDPGSDPFVYTPNLSDYHYDAASDSWKMNYAHTMNGVLGGTANIRIEELEFNPDPFVLHNILVTNVSPNPQFFSLFVGQPTVFGAPNLISGAITTQAIDGGLDGATVSTAGGLSIYEAQIDLVTVESMQDHPFSVVAPPGGVNNALANFGPQLNAVPVTFNMGIRLNFMLTGNNDSAGILSRFDIVIPEPSTFVLAGIGLGCLGVYGWRKRR